MVTPIFTGRVNDRGQLELEQPRDFERHRQQFRGKRVELILRRQRSQRSNQQNRYYWGVVIALLAEHCGYTPEEMHEALKMHFLFRDEGKALPTVRSTATMTPQEFEEYLACVRQWALVELNVVIPLPNEAEAA